MSLQILGGGGSTKRQLIFSVAQDALQSIVCQNSKHIWLSYLPLMSKVIDVSYKMRTYLLISCKSWKGILLSCFYETFTLQLKFRRERE